MDSICRLCHCKCENASNLLMEDDLTHKIKEIFPKIKVSAENGLSVLACEYCSEMVETFYDYFEKVNSNQNAPITDVTDEEFVKPDIEIKMDDDEFEQGFSRVECDGAARNESQEILYESDFCDKTTATYHNVLYLCTKIQQIEAALDPNKPQIVETITNSPVFPKIMTAEMLSTVNERLKIDAVYRERYSDFMASEIDVILGYKNAVKKVFNSMFDREFALTCSWIQTKGSNTHLKDTEIMKLLFKRGMEAFPNVPPNYINDVVVNYLQNLKRNTKSKKKLEAQQASTS